MTKTAILIGFLVLAITVLNYLPKTVYMAEANFNFKCTDIA